MLSHLEAQGVQTLHKLGLHAHDVQQSERVIDVHVHGTTVQEQCRLSRSDLVMPLKGLHKHSTTPLTQRAHCTHKCCCLFHTHIKTLKAVARARKKKVGVRGRDPFLPLGSFWFLSSGPRTRRFWWERGTRWGSSGWCRSAAGGRWLGLSSPPAGLPADSGLQSTDTPFLSLRGAKAIIAGPTDNHVSARENQGVARGKWAKI